MPRKVRSGNGTLILWYLNYYGTMVFEACFLSQQGKDGVTEKGQYSKWRAAHL